MLYKYLEMYKLLNNIHIQIKIQMRCTRFCILCIHYISCIDLNVLTKHSCSVPIKINLQRENNCKVCQHKLEILKIPHFVNITNKMNVYLNCYTQNSYWCLHNNQLERNFHLEQKKKNQKNQKTI